MENENNGISSKIALVVAMVAMVIAAWAFVSVNINSAQIIQGTTANSTHTAGYYDSGLGFRVLGTNILTRSGTLTTIGAATANTATTSIAVGCIQTVATSTATPIKLAFGASNQATTTFGATGFGLVAWQFGTCP